jgi:hypothetical protein
MFLEANIYGFMDVGHSWRDKHKIAEREILTGYNNLKRVTKNKNVIVTLFQKITKLSTSVVGYTLRGIIRLFR